MSGEPTKKFKDLTPFHRGLVESLVARTQPVKAVTSPGVQWGYWLLLSSLLMVAALWLMKPAAWEKSLQPPAAAYLVSLFLGAALAAWQAVASSIPGRKAGGVQAVLLVVFLAAVVVLPFLLFVPQGEEIFELEDILKCGPDCFKAIALIGVLPWILLGWKLSRNAAFSAKWTGAWSGVSAFLLGSLVTLIHCGYWEAGHMVAVHLLTVAFFSFLATWVGAWWFSKWRR